MPLGHFLHMRRHLEQQRAQIGHEVHRDDPAEHQRNHRHREDRKGVFAGDRSGQANRQETGGGDQRASQHRHGRDLVGEGGGAHLVIALLHLAHHHLDGNDGVVYQQAQRNDQRPERYLVQAYAGVPHGQECHAQHQRNRDAHDQAGPHVNVIALPQRQLGSASRTGPLVQAQADEADRQHNQHRLDQHADELVDGPGHRLGLVLHVNQFDAGRQGFGQAFGKFSQRLAQRNDVAAFGHGHAQRDHFAPLVMHLDDRRVAVAALDVGNIGQPQLAARGRATGAIARATNRHGAQLLDGLELARHPHLHHIERGLHRPGRLNGVLLAELRQHLIQVQPELRQAFLRNFDEDFFVLHAKQLDLSDIGHAQQLLAHVIGKGLDFGVAETVGLERVNHAKDIAEVIVEERPLHAGGQRATHVTDLLAHRIPDGRHLAGPGGVIDLENDLRLAGLGIAADLVGIGHFLQRALELVGDLLGHLLRRGTRPVGAHHHGPKGEGRVFILPQLEVGGKAQQQQHQQQITGQRRMLERPARQVEAGRAGIACGGGAAAVWGRLRHAGLISRPKQRGRQLRPGPGLLSNQELLAPVQYWLQSHLAGKC